MSRWRRDWENCAEALGVGCSCTELGGMGAESQSLFILEKTSGRVVRARTLDRGVVGAKEGRWGRKAQVAERGRLPRLRVLPLQAEASSSPPGGLNPVSCQHPSAGGQEMPRAVKFLCLPLATAEDLPARLASRTEPGC